MIIFLFCGSTCKDNRSEMTLSEPSARCPSVRIRMRDVEGRDRTPRRIHNEHTRVHSASNCRIQYIDILSAGLSDVTMTEAHDRLSGAKVILINTFIATLLFDWQQLL